MLEGHEVFVADNYFTGRKRNVEHWLGHENFELLHHDIVNPLFLEVRVVCVCNFVGRGLLNLSYPLYPCF